MADPTVFRNGYFALTTATGSAAYVNTVGIKNINAPISRAELADAVMGDDIAAIYPGIMTAPVTVEHRQDFATAAAGIDKKYWNLFNNRTAVRAKIRPTSGAVASTNPSLVYNRVFVTSVTPIMGQHGQLLGNKIELRVGSGGTVVRSTAT